MYKSCTIIGPKPTRFKFKYKEHFALCKKLKKAIQNQCCQLYDKGIREFYVGSALGVDLWTSEILINLKQQTAYSDLKLFLVIPFSNHTAEWDIRSKKRFQKILAHCNSYFVQNAQPAPDVYKKCGYYLIEQADVLLAVYDDTLDKRSAVGQSVHYAQSRNIPFIFIHPDTASILSAPN